MMQNVKPILCIKQIIADIRLLDYFLTHKILSIIILVFWCYSML